MFTDEITINPSSSCPEIRTSVDPNQEASNKIKPEGTSTGKPDSIASTVGILIEFINILCH
ncbi:hypothetical protein PITCH_A330008 [uncultured Desulfobacterium sp.]|uniref:Uncharacterized protein n=1 Tax=uncultured Desulfobacterium sp. TaxID=201089 RepID=A0A445MZ89_9BACT|nr:hypothetical protein PITCH_A330008 [uncultured Desulfobacterium sp.]